MKERRMYGLWASPITPGSLATTLRLSEPCWDTDGRTLGWVEGRSDRGVLVVQDVNGGAPRDLTPPDLSVRAFVGYGGGDFTLAHGAAYFVAQADQRIYRQELAGGPARPITPGFGASASPAVSPDGRWVAYVHTYEGVDRIALADTAGKQWPVRLAEGRDFYMQPTWHPDGDRLAWIEWSHPNMPWDGTELKVAHLEFPEHGMPRVARVESIAGGKDVSIFQPLFSPDGRALLYISDETGWSHVYWRDLESGETSRITDGEGEFGEPAWNYGVRRMAITGGGRLVALRNAAGFARLVVAPPGESPEDREDLHEGYSWLDWPAASTEHELVAFVASSGLQPPRVIVIDLGADQARDSELAPSVRRRSSGETVPFAELSVPEPVAWTSFDGEQAYGLYYPPASTRFEAEGPAPLIVICHGGPTSQVRATWSGQAQFFATRGFGVLHVNYRGSTGYGRDYMLKLRENWGLYDVQDCKTGAEALVQRGLADGKRLVIMGGSAGGFTVLQSLVDVPGFYKAGICLYGVSNQFTLASDTHKFEERYSDSLLGPLPEAAARYRERSPLFHADRIVDPVALYQGAIDRVVVRSQSDSIAASLRARGVPHEYTVYEGEGHGWRKAETIEAFYQSVEKFLREYVIYS
ncbi:MAG: prolyl oligopeptidase family serine peptidase [Hyphomicrobiales bacterium]